MMTDLASTTPQSLGRDSMVGLRLARVDGFEPAIALGQDELPAYLRRFTMLFADEATMRREINALAAGADWVFPGLAEGELLTGHKTPEAVAQFYRAQGASLVVVKLGEAGAYYDDANAGTGYVDGCPVDKMVDTVGAGDAFAVGVVSGLLDGKSVPEAVKRGCWIGALQVQVLGDSEGLPTRAALTAAGY